jgi:hypothetical protein
MHFRYGDGIELVVACVLLLLWKVETEWMT